MVLSRYCYLCAREKIRIGVRVTCYSSANVRSQIGILDSTFIHLGEERPRWADSLTIAIRVCAAQRVIFLGLRPKTGYNIQAVY